MRDFKTYVGAAGEWEWKGDPSTGTSRAVAMLAGPALIGNYHVMIGLAKIPPTQAAPMHMHEDFEEFVYVLEGDGEFLTVDSPPHPVGPGSINIVGPGTMHAHRTVGDQDLVFLWGYSPPGSQTK